MDFFPKCRNFLFKMLTFAMICVVCHQFGIIIFLKSFWAVKLDETPTKKILFYTSYFGVEDFRFGFGQQPFIDAECPVNNCFTTKNRSLLDSISKFDAILFHIRDMDQGNIQLPTQRRSDQKYVMFLLESPLHDEFPFENFNSFFNWTMTYRLDSDIYLPYGYVLPIDPSITSNPRRDKFPFPSGNASLINIIAKDLYFKNLGKRFAAWMVSNSQHPPSRRDKFVAELSNYIEIDIYGPDKDLKCPREAEIECLQVLNRSYKFYLSFENSICKDYATEKFFKVLNLNIIPVVLGGADYSRIAPDKSYIDVKDFSSIRQLADYLKYLDSNVTAYAEYFEWKHFYTSITLYYKRAFCQLCQILNDESYHVSRPLDVYKWWKKDGKCIERDQNQWPWIKDEADDRIKFQNKKL